MFYLDEEMTMIFIILPNYEKVMYINYHSHKSGFLTKIGGEAMKQGLERIPKFSIFQYVNKAIFFESLFSH